MRLRNKIHLYSSVLFAVLLVLLSVIVYVSFSSQMISNELNRFKAESSNIAYNVIQAAGEIPAVDLLRAYVPVEGMIRVVDANSQAWAVVTSSSAAALSKSPVVTYPGQHSDIVTFSSQNYALTSIPIIWDNGEVVQLQVTESLRTIEDNQSVLRRVLTVATLIAMIPVILSGWLLSNLITRPITSMIQTMQEIRKSGRFKRLKLAERSKDELYEMGETFNHMIDLLETNSEKQEQFISNASHELKTPLTVIESYASLLKRRGLERPDLFEESVEAIHSEAVRMRELTEQLLLLARADEQWDLELEEIELRAMVNNVAQAFEKAYRREIKVVAHSEVVVYSDEQRLKQLLFIFLDNARKYSEQSITVFVGRTGDDSFIRIEDRGIGIPRDELDKVFDRFYRVDKARSRKEGSSGLGLALSQDIADVLGARLELDSLENVGTTVTMFFTNSSFLSKI